MNVSRKSGVTVPQALGRLRIALDASFDAAGRELGLTRQQAELLCAAMAPAPVGELAVALHCDRSNISHLASRAADRGFVRRRPSADDGRVSLIELTPKGERLARRFIAALEAQVEPLLAGWTQTRRADAVATLTALAEALERVGAHNE